MDVIKDTKIYIFSKLETVKTYNKKDISKYKFRKYKMMYLYVIGHVEFKHKKIKKKNHRDNVIWGLDLK